MSLKGSLYDMRRSYNLNSEQVGFPHVGYSVFKGQIKTTFIYRIISLAHTVKITN